MCVYIGYKAIGYKAKSVIKPTFVGSPFVNVNLLIESGITEQFVFVVPQIL